MSYVVYSEYVHIPFLDFAREQGKPVMVAESAPQSNDPASSTYGEGGQPKTPEEIWEERYAPFFNYFHENADVIRAVAYINVHWMCQEMWQAELANNDLYWTDMGIAYAYLDEAWS